MDSPLGAGERQVELMLYIKGSQILRVSDQLESFLKHRLLWAPLSEFLTLANVGWRLRNHISYKLLTCCWFMDHRLNINVLCSMDYRAKDETSSGLTYLKKKEQ